MLTSTKKASQNKTRAPARQNPWTKTNKLAIYDFVLHEEIVYHNLFWLSCFLLRVHPRCKILAHCLGLLKPSFQFPLDAEILGWEHLEFEHQLLLIFIQDHELLVTRDLLCDIGNATTPSTLTTLHALPHRLGVLMQRVGFGPLRLTFAIGGDELLDFLQSATAHAFEVLELGDQNAKVVLLQEFGHHGFMVLL